MAYRKALAAIAFLLVAAPALAGDDAALERMATCQDSWRDWQKTEPARLETFAAHFRGGFAPHGDDAYAVPTGPTAIAGLRVRQAFPNSVGMGVGFSVMVDAPLAEARPAIEKSLGRKLAKCESGDGMESCGLEIAPERTVVLMSEDSATATTTLVGCYYFYEK